MNKDDLVFRLYTRAEIRRNIPTRKSVQEGKPDRLADLLDEAAKALESRNRWIQQSKALLFDLSTFCLPETIFTELHNLIEEGGGYDYKTESPQSQLRWPDER